MQEDWGQACVRALVQQFYTPKYGKIWYDRLILGGIAMKTEELKIKYPSGFEHAVHMTKEEMEQHIRLTPGKETIAGRPQKKSVCRNAL